MSFDAYCPTRTPRSVEVRVRASASGTVALLLGGDEVRLDPAMACRDRYFFRHVFDDLIPDTDIPIIARHLDTGEEAVVNTSTLPAPPGASKLRIGVMADLHLPIRKTSIEQYHPGVKRLTGLAYELAERYIQRLAAIGAEVIVLPGDLVDPCTPETIGALRRILDLVSVPCYPIIGNHEPWSSKGEALFYEGLGLPEEGYYTVQKNGVRMLMLSTPSPDALHNGSRQLRWLERQLESATPEEDIILFSHFSLILHPCVEGRRNDGYQLLDNHPALLRLLAGYPNVRIFAAGHKNVPSQVARDGIIHTLSPQLIQSPCGYDLFTLYDGGVERNTFEIDEQHYCEVARAAYVHDWPVRYGDESGRNFSLSY